MRGEPRLAAEHATPGPEGDERAEGILAAACRAIVRLGFSETRIRDIAREAGVSTGTVHYYFETKDDVLVAALRWANERSTARINELIDAGGDATTRLAQLLQLSVPFPGELADWWLLWIELWTRVPHRPDLLGESEQISRRWRSLFFDVVRGGVESGEFRPSSGADEAAEWLIAVTDGLAFQVVIGQSWMPRERMRELLLGFAAEQLGVPYETLERAAAETPLP